MIGRRGKAPLGGARGLVLLGPQRGRALLAEVCRELEAGGRLEPGRPVATITAGWQEREGETEVLCADVGRPTVDLELYRRAERLAAEDLELAEGHHAVQGRLRLLRSAYNRRLEALMAAHTALHEMEGDPGVLDPERDDAIAALRALDARHLARVAELRGEYEERFRPLEREGVVREREAIRAALDGIEVVLIAGGHVASLLNRLRLFGLADFLRGRTVVAWSAGAMALGRRIVLFHDRPPWGPGNAEAFENGLGLFGGLVPFPHASERLLLDDALRTSRLARRMLPDACALFDPGVRIDREDGAWRPNPRARRLDPGGGVVPFAEVAA